MIKIHVGRTAAADRGDRVEQTLFDRDAQPDRTEEALGNREVRRRRAAAAGDRRHAAADERRRVRHRAHDRIRRAERRLDARDRDAGGDRDHERLGARPAATSSRSAASIWAGFTASSSTSLPAVSSAYEVCAAIPNSLATHLRGRGRFGRGPDRIEGNAASQHAPQQRAAHRPGTDDAEPRTGCEGRNGPTFCDFHDRLRFWTLEWGSRHVAGGGEPRAARRKSWRQRVSGGRLHARAVQTIPRPKYLARQTASRPRRRRPERCSGEHDRRIAGAGERERGDRGGRGPQPARYRRHALRATAQGRGREVLLLQPVDRRCADLQRDRQRAEHPAHQGHSRRRRRRDGRRLLAHVGQDRRVQDRQRRFAQRHDAAGQRLQRPHSAAAGHRCLRHAAIGPRRPARLRSSGNDAAAADQMVLAGGIGRRHSGDDAPRDEVRDDAAGRPGVRLDSRRHPRPARLRRHLRSVAASTCR